MNRYRVLLVFSWLICSILIKAAEPDRSAQTITIGSKAFPESHLLAEIAAQLLESNGFSVERKLGLGGTLIAYQALEQNEIDLYPEYSGTVLQVLLKNPKLSFNDMQKALKERQLQMLEPLGFNNGYALVMLNQKATDAKLKSIEDLIHQPNLNISVSLEFLNRSDGWEALKQAYQLPQKATGIEHALAYTALLSGQIDITDAYTTDGKLAEYPITLLRDNRNFFPEYRAAYLSTLKLPAKVKQQLNRLAGLFTDDLMQQLNQQHARPESNARLVARNFLIENKLIDRKSLGETTFAPTTMVESIVQNTLQHLLLTITALIAAALFAIPTSLAIAHKAQLAKTTVYMAGLLQTIPSLALLALMIPIFGLGELPAICALFLYSLLPIIRNTVTGIQSVDPLLKQVAKGMGLSLKQQLLKIELPLAMPAILAGIKTAAIISLGTATLAAFVGAGGLGEPIITGLTLNDQSLILQGAIPVALLAIVTELFFEILERKLLPVHLQSKSH